MDERTSEASRIFTILFIIVGHFIIFNIFISVNIENIQQANESFHEQVSRNLINRYPYYKFTLEINFKLFFFWRASAFCLSQW